MTKVISFTILHYGMPYLEYSLRSVADVVREAWVLYTPRPSHGTGTHLRCPDHPRDLFEAAKRGAGDKLRWYTGVWPHEGAHRDAIAELCPDADIIVVVDSDEIWGEGLARQGVDFALSSDAGQIDVPFVHYWRSFYNAVTDDALLPVRIKNVRNDQSIRASVFNPVGVVNHMGYAQPTQYIMYKSPIHGHRGEWRKEWFSERWLPNCNQDVHPVIHNHWYPKPIDPWSYLPDFAFDHPFANLELIP